MRAASLIKISYVILVCLLQTINIIIDNMLLEKFPALHGIVSTISQVYYEVFDLRRQVLPVGLSILLNTVTIGCTGNPLGISLKRLIVLLKEFVLLLEANRR